MGAKFKVAIAVVLHCNSSALLAQPTSETAGCQSPDAEKRLVGCTGIIDAKGFGSQSRLAAALDARCWAYNTKGQFGRAIADCKAAIALTGLKARPSASIPSTNGPGGRVIIVPLQNEGGTYVVPVVINNTITLNFVVDSGAADVSIPADVLSTLIRAGTIDKSDFIGAQTYTLADGSSAPSAPHTAPVKGPFRFLKFV